MQRTAGAAGVAREFKDICELGGVPAFNQFYVFGIFVWKALYRGLYKPWHVILAPTVGDDKARRELYRLNAPKAVCAELASLVWGEECEINVSMNGRESTSEDPDPLGHIILFQFGDEPLGELRQELRRHLRDRPVGLIVRGLLLFLIGYNP